MAAFEDDREVGRGEDVEVQSPSLFQRALEDEMAAQRHEPVRQLEIEVRSLVAQTLSPERQRQIDDFKAELLALPKDKRLQRVMEMRVQDPELVNSVQASFAARSRQVEKNLQAVQDGHEIAQRTDAMILRAVTRVGNDTLEDLRKKRRSA